MELGSGLDVPFNANIDFPSNYEVKHSRRENYEKRTEFPFQKVSFDYSYKIKQSRFRPRGLVVTTRPFQGRNAEFNSRRGHQETKFLYNNAGKCNIVLRSLDGSESTQ